MVFVPRPQGSTLRRVQEAFVDPHPAAERFDPEFRVAMHCSKCGRVGYGPRSQIKEALREHLESECPARHTDGPQVTRVLSPRL